ncbi:MAG: hypothetical protein SPG67_04705 [Sodaliphilus sp.]|nr:hypothetical protein [Sodaliphilus sp.]
MKYHVPTGLFFLFLCPYDFSTEPLYGGAEGKRKNSHRFFGIFIRLNLCEINGLLFEPCSALSNF